MKNFALLLTGATAALVVPTAVHAQKATGAVIVVVDTDKISQTCTACVAAQGVLRTQDTNFQSRRTALLTPLQTEEQSIAQALEAAQKQPAGAGRTAAENALKPRIDAFNTRRQAAATELQNLQRNFESTRINVSQQLQAKLGPIYTQVMNSRGANVMLPIEATLARANGLDVTNDVLTLLNQQAPSFQVVPLPQQPAPAQPGR